MRAPERIACYFAGTRVAADDAHGFGVPGQRRGTLVHIGLASERVVYMGTPGKAAGVAGAFVAARESVIETLIHTEADVDRFATTLAELVR